jgi:GDP-L-fucose synthase
VVGFAGRIAWDSSKPDGTPRKLLDVGKLHALGWRAEVSFAAGVRSTYQWYPDNVAAARAVA